MEVRFSDLCPGPNTVYHTFFVWVAVAPSLWHPNWILHPTPSSTPPWRLRWKLIGHCISSIFAPPKLMRLNTCLTVSMWAARIKYPCAKARKVYASRGQNVQKSPFFRLRKKYRETITKSNAYQGISDYFKWHSVSYRNMWNHSRSYLIMLCQT